MFTIQWSGFYLSEEEKDRMTIPEKSRKTFQRGVQLFIGYIFVYTLFIIAGTARKELLMIRVLGLNLGIVAGVAIIAGAILIAVYYNWYAGKMEAN